jgi:release factor glutamine methyltransferase
MNIRTALLWGEDDLQYLENPKLEAEILLAGVLKKDRIFLKTNPEFPMSVREKRLYKKCVQRRLEGFPVAQILKYKDWAGFRIVINKHVLIPRDETEILCEHICEISRKDSVKRILDVGTGSGIIAIFLKHHFPEAMVQALDISKRALRVARKNAKKHQPSIEFLRSNLLDKIEENEQYDIIVANLPYVPENISISREVSKEPRKAIFSGSDGLDLLRTFAEQLKEKNIRFQELWLEFLPQQEKSIEDLFKEYDVQFFTDTEKTVRFARIMIQKS